MIAIFQFFTYTQRRRRIIEEDLLNEYTIKVHDNGNFYINELEKLYFERNKENGRFVIDRKVLSVKEHNNIKKQLKLLQKDIKNFTKSSNNKGAHKFDNLESILIGLANFIDDVYSGLNNLYSNPSNNSKMELKKRLKDLKSICLKNVTYCKEKYGECFNYDQIEKEVEKILHLYTFDCLEIKQ